jgi:putative hydrolase of the HAD superfamily
LLDAGGVLVFPAPSHVLPPLRAAGLDPDLATLERAHYQAMANQDAAEVPPVSATWWRDYLVPYVAACGVAPDRCEAIADQMAGHVEGRSWAHAGLGARDGLRAVAALGVPIGVVSNSDGSVEADLRSVGMCYAPAPAKFPGPGAPGPGAPGPGASGPAGSGPAGSGPADHAPAAPVPDGAVPVGVIIDSAVVGVAKPDPAIFAIALSALGVPPDGTVLHVGDSLRYDVAGALAAGLQPVHMDPFSLCPAPDDHLHIRRLADLPALAGG